eukprot:CAMPEP_0167815896 /NCGR_PEP_ID=MMETSP0112_2-20121227/3285_1 /TAXON_ID=91324 /ORGANISM="Lotharella globosa, Strain CCCM811" /LENGTH=752 /DNA_ID=CAMNT_0007715383 /DNA_START=82 /DNA_END=2340 /DNA_ORIENTATION=+
MRDFDLSPVYSEFSAQAVEGIYHFLYLEPKVTHRFKKIEDLKFAIPDTVIYSRGQTIGWYSKSAIGAMEKVPLLDITSKRILKEFQPKIKGRRARTHVCAVFLRLPEPMIQDICPKPTDDEKIDMFEVLPEPCEFMTFEDLEKFLATNDPNRHGILQKFIYPSGSKNEQIRLSWSADGFTVEKRKVLHDMDLPVPIYDRCVTYEGPLNHNQYETRDITLTKSRTVRHLQQLCVDIIRHISQVSRRNMTKLSKLVMYFKVQHRTTYLLWCSCLEMDLLALSEAGSYPTTIDLIKKAKREMRNNRARSDGPLPLFRKKPSMTTFSGNMLARMSSLMRYKEEQNIKAEPAVGSHRNSKKGAFRCPGCRGRVPNKDGRFRCRTETVLRKLVIEPSLPTWSHFLIKKSEELANGAEADMELLRASEQEAVRTVEEDILKHLREFHHIFGENAMGLLEIANKIAMPERKMDITAEQREALNTQVTLCGACADRIAGVKPADENVEDDHWHNPNDEYYNLLLRKSKRASHRTLEKTTNRLYPQPAYTRHTGVMGETYFLEDGDIFKPWEKAYDKLVSGRSDEKDNEDQVTTLTRKDSLKTSRTTRESNDKGSAPKGKYCYRAVPVKTSAGLKLGQLPSARLHLSPLRMSSRPSARSSSRASGSTCSTQRRPWKHEVVKDDPLFETLTQRVIPTSSSARAAKIRPQSSRLPQKPKAQHNGQIPGKMPKSSRRFHETKRPRPQKEWNGRVMHFGKNFSDFD